MSDRSPASIEPEWVRKVPETPPHLVDAAARVVNRHVASTDRSMVRQMLGIDDTPARPIGAPCLGGCGKTLRPHNTLNAQYPGTSPTRAAGMCHTCWKHKETNA